MPSKIKKPVSKAKKTRRYRPHHFVAAWLRAPLKVGAVVPSSRALAKSMAAQIDCESVGLVIELGPGTGVVTKALLAHGIAPGRLLVVERDKRFFNFMRAQFPELPIVRADAMELASVVRAEGRGAVHAIVSSLPLLSMPKAVRGAIEKQMAELIGEGGMIVQFTYGAKSPISGDELKKYRLRGKRVKSVIANIPPAHVWVYRRD